MMAFDLTHGRLLSRATKMSLRTENRGNPTHSVFQKTFLWYSQSLSSFMSHLRQSYEEHRELDTELQASN